MTRPDRHARSYLERRSLLFLLVLVSLAFLWVLLPFYGAIMWSVVIALMFRPLQRWLSQRLGRRRTLAALLTMLVALLMVIVPLALLVLALTQELAHLLQRLQSGEVNPVRALRDAYALLPASVTSVLERLGMADFEALQQRLTRLLEAGGHLMGGQLLNLGQFTFDVVAGFFITVYLAFFLIRDGEQLAASVRRLLPLAIDHQDELLAKFKTVVHATFKGGLVVAAVQGLLGGLMLWLLGVSGALLWGVLMAFLSLLPAVGAALVWVPVAVHFFLGGDYGQGVALVAYGVLVIGSVDNLLRPVLVGRETRLPDYLVMITTLGGLAVFGVHGLLLGPAIAAMFIAVWHIYGKSQA